MSQRLMEKVESTSIIDANEESALSLPPALIEDLDPSERITYRYERPSRPWFDGQIGAFRALSANKAGDATRGNPGERVQMDIPGYGRIWLPIKKPCAKVTPTVLMRQLVDSVENATGLRPLREVSTLSGQLDEYSARFDEAKETHRILQGKYNNLIVSHDELESEYQHRIANGSGEPLDEADAERAKLDTEPSYEIAETIAECAERLAISRSSIQSARIELHEQSLEVTKISAAIGYLERYLRQLDADNQGNETPIRAAFQLTGQLDTPDNHRYLGEMGYEIGPR